MAATKATATITTTATAAATAQQQTVLITGASRGIGLGLVEVYAKKGWRVIAAARDPAKAAALQALVKAYPKAVATVTLDVADSKSVAALAGAVAAVPLSPAVTSLDLLYNNAGVVGEFGAIDKESVANFAGVFRTNVIGVWEVTQALLPLLRSSKAVGGPKVAHISSTMGSIADTLDGAWPGLAAAYRVSKAALNELGAVQSREFNEPTVKALASADAAVRASAAPLITVVQVHPGWVDTDMGRGAGKPPTTVVQSTTGIEAAVSAAKPNPKAIFVDFENKTIPW